MKNAIAVLLLAAVAGCARSQVLPLVPTQATISEFNRAAAGRKVTVTRADGEPLAMVGPRLAGGSLLWHDSVAAGDRQMSLSEIHSLRFSNPGRAFNRGLKLGGAAGLVLSTIAFLGTAGNCQGGNCSVSSRLPLFALTIPVALIGGIAGTASPEVYTVSPAMER